MGEAALQTPVKKEGQEVMQALRSRDSPVDHGEAGCPPAAHRSTQGRNYPHAAYSRAGRCALQGAVTLWRAHTGAVFLGVPVAL